MGRLQQTTAKTVYIGPDSGGDTDDDYDEQPTPRPHPPRAPSKKRLSDVHDSSFTDPSSRPPLKSVNINDDAAEKRRRRKSAKLGGVGDEMEVEGGGVKEEERENARLGKGKQLASVAEAPAINVPLDVMSSNFEEWMKMATDNKINAANSWNFALIDYFHDMSLLRNNTDNSINFQRASCTLDGCVKIWTSRVDSVGTETGKLLSNLANEGRNVPDGDENLDEDGGGEGGEGAEKRKKKAHRPGSTLAKDVSQLRNKKLDLEFHVDPLFRKTCADFDEGGAQGLLMNHLALGVGSDGSLRVVFDASDSRGRGEEDEALLDEPPSEVDLSYLRENFMSSLDTLEDFSICPSLSDFSFAQAAFAFSEPLFRDGTPATYDNPHEHDDDENEPFNDHGVDGFGVAIDGGVEGPGGEQAEEDFFVGDQAVGDDYHPDSPDNFNDDSQAPYGDAAGGHAQGANTGAPGPFVSFDPRRAHNERELVMAMSGGEGVVGEDGEGGFMMDYFDQGFLKNWAGPEHWKLRKVVRKADPADPQQQKEKAPKVRKEPYKIDFLSPSDKDPKEIAKELFVPVTRGAGITLPPSAFAKNNSKRGTKRKKGKKGKGGEGDGEEGEGAEGGKDRRSDMTLPDDMHFSSRQLVTLFLKPRFSLKMRGQRSRLDDRDGEIDEGFWAQAAANQAAGRNEDGDETADPSNIPFNTQFFQDDYDDGGGFDDDDLGLSSAPPLFNADPATEPGEQDLLAATQGQTRRVRPEFVNYAKRAKRVDVRRLKESIWRGLDIVVPTRKARGEDEMDVEDDEEVEEVDEVGRPATDPKEARTFERVITGLRGNYPKDKMEEISTSFCFICLLHLANERGLKLESGIDGLGAVVVEGGMDLEDEGEEKRVGNIWDLKVYRDPDAIPSA